MPAAENNYNHPPPVEDAQKGFKLAELLTGREQEVLSLLAKGLTNSEIAERLHISKHTVKNHISSIYRKIGINDRTQIALLAIRNGFVSID